jgi:hypothetical protein
MDGPDRPTTHGPKQAQAVLENRGPGPGCGLSMETTIAGAPSGLPCCPFWASSLLGRKESKAKERDARMLLVCWATLGRSATPREHTVSCGSVAARAAHEAGPNHQNFIVFLFFHKQS